MAITYYWTRGDSSDVNIISHRVEQLSPKFLVYTHYVIAFIFLAPENVVDSKKKEIPPALVEKVKEILHQNTRVFVTDFPMKYRVSQRFHPLSPSSKPVPPCIEPATDLIVR